MSDELRELLTEFVDEAVNGDHFCGGVPTEWTDRFLAALSDAPTVEYEQVGWRNAYGKLSQHRLSVGDVPVYVKRDPTPTEWPSMEAAAEWAEGVLAPQADRCPTCGNTYRRYPCPDPWHKGADR